MIYYIMIFICGLIFGVGLTISGMIDANKILNFLDVTGTWDPSLAFVMLGAVTVTWLGYRFVLRSSRPKLSEKFFLPQKKDIDKKLILGAALFGVGWGMAGYCPGPAISALGLGIMDPVYFIMGFVFSALVYWLLNTSLRS